MREFVGCNFALVKGGEFPGQRKGAGLYPFVLSSSRIK
jgi:hypothetical protein